MFDTPVLGVQRLSLEPPAADRVLRHAVDRGVRWFDTADVYGFRPGDAERQLAGILRDTPGLSVATKGGLVRDGAEWRPDGRASRLRDAALASRDRLGVDTIALYQLHAPDPRTPFETSVRALVRLQAHGVVRAVGLCNVTVGQLDIAAAELAVACVQVELSPFRPYAVHSGIVETARERGIPVLAYRPLGGVQGIRRLRRDPVLTDVASAVGATPEEVVLAWLRGLGVVPLAGPTRIETVDSLVASAALTLPPELQARLDRSFEPGRIAVPRSRRAPRPEAGGDVVIVMGSPGAGKSSRIAPLAETHLRLNRDARGGTLKDLLPALDEALRSGVRRVVLDNTYASRASRNGVIETAWAHGVPVRCEWITTSDREAEVNTCERIWDRLGRLPEPAELAVLNRRDPSVIPPAALFRFRSELEPPSVAEGFARVDAIPFVRRPSEATGRALVLDPADLHPSRQAWLASFVDRGFVLLVLGWEPTADPAGALDRIHARAAALGLVPHAASCPHPPGPSVCWCRKPLPGLLVQALRVTGCDPARSIALGTSPADRLSVSGLGIRLFDPTR